MLLRFEVSNFRSISEPVELSMVAVDDDRPAVRRFDLLSEPVLTAAGIYGPNASGKSNVVEALAWLSAAVQQSLRAPGIYPDPACRPAPSAGRQGSHRHSEGGRIRSAEYHSFEVFP